MSICRSMNLSHLFALSFQPHEGKAAISLPRAKSATAMLSDLNDGTNIYKKGGAEVTFLWRPQRVQEGSKQLCYACVQVLEICHIFYSYIKWFFYEILRYNSPVIRTLSWLETTNPKSLIKKTRNPDYTIQNKRHIKITNTAQSSISIDF